MNAKRFVLSIIVILFALAGFVPATSVFAKVQTTTPAWVTSPKMEVTATGAINFRVEPTTDATSLGTLPTGALVQKLATVTQTDGTWFLVRWQDVSTSGFGWARGDVLKTATAAATAKWQLPVCLVTNKGIQIPVAVHFGTDYVIDPMQTSCSVLVEGRQKPLKEHHIWILRDNNVELDLAATNGILQIMEGSLWFYDPTWNMSDFSTAKPPIASEFVTQKRQDQKAVGYDWPIIVHAQSGDTTFPAGTDTPKITPVNNAAFAEPQKIKVAGIWNGKNFSAAVGGLNAVTVALVDDTVQEWTGSRDSFAFAKIEAYLMPSTWSQDQITAWALKKWPGKKIEMINLDGSPVPTATAVPSATPEATPPASS